MKCRECKYWRQRVSDLTTGVCHCLPGSLVKHRNDWCGEFVPRKLQQARTPVPRIDDDNAQVLVKNFEWAVFSVSSYNSVENNQALDVARDELLGALHRWRL